MIGETFGSYRILARIGEGGMGAIYLAEQPLIGRRVAVKVLLPELSANQSALDRFFNEARTTAKLRHPALVDVFDFGVHQPSGRAYIIMELLEGETLGRLLQRAGRLPAADAVDYAQQIAQAVGIAHGAGIIHRDLKPDNVFLIADPWRPGHRLVKVLDFGIAKLTAPGSPGTTKSGNVIGTPLYMAPEQCRGAGNIDARADIYSIGCILYAMICGRPPFLYEGFGEIIIAQVGEPLAPPHTLEPSVPAELEAIIIKALAKDPALRQQTTAELASELSRVPQDGLGRTLVLSPDPSVPYVVSRTPSGSNTFSAREAAPLPRAPSRRRALLAGGAAAAGVIIAGVALIGRTGSGPSQPIPVQKTQPAVVRPPVEVEKTPVQREKPPVQREEVVPAPPATPAEAPVPRSKRSPRPSASPVTITITNAREGLTVSVDGRPSALPLRLPRDHKPHRVLFRTPNFHPETRSLVGDKDQTITLANRPAFITQ